MKTTLWIYPLLCLVWIFGALPATAEESAPNDSISNPLFIKIDGISGTSNDPNHPGELAAFYCEFGSNPAIDLALSTAGIRTGKMKASLIEIVRFVDSSSTKLLEYCSSGQVVPKAKISIRTERGGEDWLIVELTDVSVVKYTVGFSAGGDPFPVETLQLGYNSMSVTFESASLPSVTTEWKARK